jgi:hypothetical protein
MKILLAITALFLTIGAAKGSLGETPDECALRYGSASGNLSPDQIIYQRSGITIIVRFRDGRSIQEDFAPQAATRLSEAEIKQLLEENGRGSIWETNGETAAATDYFRKDGKASARAAKEGAELSMQHAQLIIKSAS